MRALLVAAALAVAPASAAADRATAAALAKVPGDVAFVASVDVARARKTRAYRKLPAELRRDAERLRVERAWIVMPASAFGGARQMALLATTPIDEAEFLAYIDRKPKVVAKKAHGRTYYLTGDHAWAYLDGQILLAPPDYVERVLETDGPAATDSVELMTAVAAADRAGAHAWMAMVLPESARAELRKQSVVASLADIRWIAGRITIDRGARFAAEIRAGSAASAEAIGSLLRMATGMKTSDATLESLTFAVRESSVEIAGALSAAALDDALRRMNP
jgi:hypothetical protein